MRGAGRRVSTPSPRLGTQNKNPFSNSSPQMNFHVSHTVGVVKSVTELKPPLRSCLVTISEGRDIHGEHTAIIGTIAGKGGTGEEGTKLLVYEYMLRMEKRIHNGSDNLIREKPMLTSLFSPPPLSSLPFPPSPSSGDKRQECERKFPRNSCITRSSCPKRD